MRILEDSKDSYGRRNSAEGRIPGKTVATKLQQYLPPQILKFKTKRLSTWEAEKTTVMLSVLKGPRYFLEWVWLEDW